MLFGPYFMYHMANVLCTAIYRKSFIIVIVHNSTFTVCDKELKLSSAVSVAEALGRQQ